MYVACFGNFSMGYSRCAWEKWISQYVFKWIFDDSTPIKVENGKYTHTHIHIHTEHHGNKVLCGIQMGCSIKKREQKIIRCMFKTSVWRNKLVRISDLVADDTGAPEMKATRKKTCRHQFVLARAVCVCAREYEANERVKNFSYNVEKCQSAVSTIILCISKHLNEQTLNL